MPRPIERTFDHRKPVLVRRTFKAAGRSLQPGQPFNWQRLAVDVRRVRLLYEGGYLGHEDDPLMDELIVVATTDDDQTDDDQTPAQDGDAPADETPAQDGDAPVEETPAQEGDAPVEETPAPTQDADRDADLQIDSLSALQDIASSEGAPIKPSKAAQREAIIAVRDAKS